MHLDRTFIRYTSHPSGRWEVANFCPTVSYVLYVEGRLSFTIILHLEYAERVSEERAAQSVG